MNAINSYIEKIASHDWVSFSVSKIKNPQLLWMCNDYFYEQKEMGINASIINTNFLNEYSYAIHDSDCFEDDVDFDIENTRIAIAEVYGGHGIGSNGGGARCGNWKRFQVKGIGTNPLIGASNDRLHSYGGLDAPAAVLETINCCVLNKIMPHGATKVIGLILVSKTSGYDITKESSAWGVLLIREKALRPAHLMRNLAFKPNFLSYKPTNDAARVKRINKEIFRELDGSSRFIKFLADYLKNQANQYAFARCARILNGVLTPSNNTLDGRWIDLNSCGLVDSGSNYYIGSGFLSEHEAPLNYALELLYNFTKYNRVQLNPQPLINYYNEQFLAYFEYHTCWLIGIPYESFHTLEKKHLHNLSFLIYKIIHSNKHGTLKRATINIHDPIWFFLKFFYSLPFNRNLLDDELRKYIGKENYGDLKVSANYLFENSKKIHNKFELKNKNIWIAQSLVSLKKAIYSSLYYLSHMEDHVRNFLSSATIDCVAPYIETYKNAAKWIFNDDISVVIIYKSDSINVYYKTIDNFYAVDFKNGKTLKFMNFYDLSNFLKAHNLLCTMNHFSPITFFEYMTDLMNLIEEDVQNG